MTASCPICSTALPWDTASGTHVCRSCNAILDVESDASKAAWIVLWTIAEVPLFLLVPIWWMRILLSWGLGMAIWYLICGSATKTVSPRPASAGPQADGTAGPL